MSDFLIYSETRCPVFVYVPRTSHHTKINTILMRFYESLQIGELEQAVTMLDLGIKQNIQPAVFKFNIGVAYLLQKRYLEAV